MLKRHVNFPGNTQRLAVILWQLGWLRFGLVPQSWLTYLSTDKAVGEVRLSPRRNAVRSKGGKVISTGSNNRKVGSGTSEKSLEKDDISRVWIWVEDIIVVSCWCSRHLGFQKFGSVSLVASHENWDEHGWTSQLLSKKNLQSQINSEALLRH